jgi:hypothetical protein
MIKSLITTIIIILFCINGYSQISNLSIRKAFETKTEDDNKPAIASFSIPTGKPDYYLINAGIGYKTDIRFLKSEWSGFAVFNFNNQIDKEQHNFKVGIAGKSLIGEDPSNFGVFGSNTFQYMSNLIDTNQSIIITSYWHLNSRKENWIKLGGYANPSKRFGYFILPQLGLEYQNLSKSKTKIENTQGYDIRGVGSIGGNFLIRTEPDTINPLSRKKLLEFTVSYQTRYSLKSSIINNPSETNLFKCGLNYYPSKNNDFSIGLSYNIGENPIEGIRKQEYWQLALQYKLN